MNGYSLATVITSITEHDVRETKPQLIIMLKPKHRIAYSSHHASVSFVRNETLPSKWMRDPT